MYNILLIEDDTDINNLMSETLTKAGYSCTQAFSGTETLLVLSKLKPDIVLLDLMLPGLNGEEVRTFSQNCRTNPQFCNDSCCFRLGF